jgi:hypothetical protein
MASAVLDDGSNAMAAKRMAAMTDSRIFMIHSLILTFSWEEL